MNSISLFRFYINVKNLVYNYNKFLTSLYERPDYIEEIFYMAALQYF
jgi:uncharacterized pyridoxamine 5'-phosphate oxidase family protein